MAKKMDHFVTAVTVKIPAFAYSFFNGERANSFNRQCGGSGREKGARHDQHNLNRCRGFVPNHRRVGRGFSLLPSLCGQLGSNDPDQHHDCLEVERTRIGFTLTPWQP